MMERVPEEIEPIVPLLPTPIRADGGRRRRRPVRDDEGDAPLVPDLS